MFSFHKIRSVQAAKLRLSVGGLLYVPGDTARTAVASALATLVSGGRRETPPGSAFGCALSRPSSTGSGVAARENMEQRLKRWCRSCEIFESVRCPGNGQKTF